MHVHVHVAARRLLACSVSIVPDECGAFHWPCSFVVSSAAAQSNASQSISGVSVKIQGQSGKMTLSNEGDISGSEFLASNPSSHVCFFDTLTCMSALTESVTVSLDG